MAQHSILVADLVRKLYPNWPMVEMCGLLHDGHEAYFADLPRPLKVVLEEYGQTAYRVLSDKCQREIDALYGYPAVSSWAHPVVKAADDYALHLEGFALKQSWDVNERRYANLVAVFGSPELDSSPEWDCILYEEISPGDAGRRFIDRYNEVRERVNSSDWSGPRGESVPIEILDATRDSSND